MFRRRLLRAGLATATVAIAGCVDRDGATDPGRGGEGDGDEPDGDGDEPDGGTDAESDEPTEADPVEPTEPGPEERTETPDRTITDRVEVISSVGLVTDGEVGAVEIVVAPAPGADPIDLREVTVLWIDDGGTYDLVAASSDTTAAVDGTFGIEPIKDGDGSAPVMNAADDRMQLSMALGESDGGTGVEGFGAPLTPGAAATLRLTTESGAETILRLNVPESLHGHRVVTL